MFKFLTLALFTVISLSSSLLIFDFEADVNTKGWKIINDNVMGGSSKGTFNVNEDGYGVFEGEIIIKRHNGFSSLVYDFDEINLNDYTKLKLRVKGDSKTYQLRIKADFREKFAYVKSFDTSGEWEEIEIPLNDMYPSFRGQKLDRPNFSESVLEQITFMVANGKNEKFKLLIDKIELSE